MILLYLPFSIIVTFCPTARTKSEVVSVVPGPFLKRPGSIATASILQFVTSSICLNPVFTTYPFLPLSSTTLLHTFPFVFFESISILNTLAPFFSVASLVEEVLFSLYT